MGAFSDDQVHIYKECFRLMDVDKDGIISKTDLRAAFDNVGRLMSDEELDAMLNEIGGTCNFDNLLKCLETKMAGDVNDPDDIIVEGIRCHDEEIIETDKKNNTIVKHLIEPEEFKHALMTFGNKMTAEEIDDIFGEFDFDDDGFILTKSVVDLFVAGGMDEKKEDDKKDKKDGKDAVGASGDAEASPGGDGGKKKKKKKKAAK